MAIGGISVRVSVSSAGTRFGRAGRLRAGRCEGRKISAPLRCATPPPCRGNARRYLAVHVRFDGAAAGRTTPAHRHAGQPAGACPGASGVRSPGRRPSWRAACGHPAHRDNRATGSSDRPLADIGGKGLFAKEIEAALLAGAIDCAVHSAKDLETRLPDGLTIAAVLPREDPRDALICPGARTLADVPRGARIGTASARRRALVRALRPDLKIQPIRGNIGTRLGKVARGEFDATLLAMAGLIRAGCVGDAVPLAVDDFLPSAGQGIVAVQCRSGDTAVRGHLASIDHAVSMAALRAERAVLAALDGSCRTPIAAHAEQERGRMTVRGLIADPDGERYLAPSRDRS